MKNGPWRIQRQSWRLQQECELQIQSLPLWTDPHCHPVENHHHHYCHQHHCHHHHVKYMVTHDSLSSEMTNSSDRRYQSKKKLTPQASLPFSPPVFNRHVRDNFMNMMVEEETCAQHVWGNGDTVGAHCWLANWVRDNRNLKHHLILYLIFILKQKLYDFTCWHFIGLRPPVREACQQGFHLLMSLPNLRIAKEFLVPTPHLKVLNDFWGWI